jgi:hypothetical protein
MFAPFTIATDTNPTAPTVHWGNVDTGSMVNIMYSGMLTHFPELQRYQQAFTHTVKGVGEKTTNVVCKLTNVPVCLGTKLLPGGSSKCTFYVLECNAYHCILGLTLLQQIDAAVFCSSRHM